ncbi:MAG: class I SAM-dependent methyltransferase [Pseudomonadales bacterium]
MKAKDYIEANRAAWNQAAPFHERSQEFTDLANGISQPDYSCLDEVQTEWLLKVGVSDKDIVHLCCNNGRELLSIKKMGAANCVGFDISSEFIGQARRLADLGDVSCQFIESDVYDIASEFDQQFDVCVVTIGVFGWMPDLGLFFEAASRLLRPGGKLFVHEEHPIVNMFEPDSDDPLQLVNSYFRPEPFIETDIIVYDGEDQGSGETHYWFVHTLSDIISGCLKTGFALEEFREYEDNISSEEYDVFEEQQAQLPLSYILVATKPE